MLIVDRGAFRKVDALDLVHDIALHRLRAAVFEELLKVDVPLGELIAPLHAVAFFCEKRRRAMHRVLDKFCFLAIGLHSRFRFQCYDLQKAPLFDALDLAVRSRQDRLAFGRPDLKEFLYARQAVRDIRARDAAGMEGAHRKLGARLADGLRGDDAHRLAHPYGLIRAEIIAVAFRADAVERLTGDRRAHLDALDLRLVDRLRRLRVDHVACPEKHFIARLEVIEHRAGEDAVREGLAERGAVGAHEVDALLGAAVLLTDHNILRNVHQAAGEISGLRGLQGRVRGTLAGAVRGDEILQDREPLLERGLDGEFYGLALRILHQALHAHHLDRLGPGAARAGIDDEIDGVLGLERALHHLGDVGLGFVPDRDDAGAPLALGEEALFVLRSDLRRGRLGGAHDLLFLGRNGKVVHRPGDAGARGVFEADLLDLVQHVLPHLETEAGHRVGGDLGERPLLEGLVHETEIRGQDLVEQDPPARGFQFCSAGTDDKGSVHRNVIVIIGRERVVEVEEAAAGALRLRIELGEIVASHDDVLRGDRHRFAGRGLQEVPRREHDVRRLALRLVRERQVHGHLVAVEVRVERGADQSRDLDREVLDQKRFERLDRETVQGRSAVQKHFAVGYHLLEDRPHLGRRLLDQAVRAFDIVCQLAFDHRGDDERLEELERHALGKAALVDVQFRTDDDDRAAGVVHALAQKVLAEAALLALQHVRERAERAALGGELLRAEARRVIDERVHRLLQHALFVHHDDLGRLELEKFF